MALRSFKKSVYALLLPLVSTYTMQVRFSFAHAWKSILIEHIF